MSGASLVTLDPEQDRGGAQAALAAVAAVGLAIALGRSHGFLDLVSVAIATLAAGLTLAAISPASAIVAASPRAPVAILAVGIAVSLVYDACVPPGFYVDHGTLRALRPLLAATAVLVASSFRFTSHPLVRRVRFGALLALCAWMGGIVIVRSPTPMIDVWHFQQIGAAALLHGFDPYLVAYPNIYGGNAAVYSAVVLSPDRLHVLGNPYPPLTQLLGVPSVALGLDVRWGTLAAVLVAAWAIRALGQATLAAELAAVLVLVQPRSLFVVEQAWTEPVVLATTVLVGLAVAGWRRDEAASAGAGRRWILTGILAGVALSSKQYTPVLLAPHLFVTPVRGRWKATALALATAAVIAAPFVVWDPRAFWRSVVAFQVAQPFRPDSLSWLSAVVALGGPLLPVWPAILAGLAVLAVGIRVAVTVEQAILAGAGAWLIIVLFNKQAFCNYYWVVVGMLCAATAAAAAPRIAPGGRRPSGSQDAPVS